MDPIFTVAGYERVSNQLLADHFFTHCCVTVAEQEAAWRALPLRTRLRRRIGARVHALRSRVAMRLAPWLTDADYCRRRAKAPVTAQIVPDLAPLAYPVAKLSPLPGNPRRGDVQSVARSYSTFGQRKPIVARREGDGGIVVAGNHQLLRGAGARLGGDRGRLGR